jgi:Fe-Mn family superoxide dismutase
MKRRQFLAASLTAGAALVLRNRTLLAEAGHGPYLLPKLPYAYDALEPYIDARTMEIHYSKHHAAYVAKLNAAVAGTTWASKTPEELVANLDLLPAPLRTAVRNNGGGTVNHTLFWSFMSHAGGGQPKGEMAKAIDAHLGGFDKFAKAFSTAAIGQFGSGWAWLVVDPKTKKLAVTGTPNQDSPTSIGQVPILGIDVWEHAYYLKYQNRRPEYVEAFFHVIDWDSVASRYAAAMKV